MCRPPGWKEKLTIKHTGLKKKAGGRGATDSFFFFFKKKLVQIDQISYFVGTCLGWSWQYHMSWGFGLAAAGLNSYYSLGSQLHLNILQAQPNSLLQHSTGHLLPMDCKFKCSKWKWQMRERSMITHAPLSVNTVLGLSYRMYNSTQIQFHSSVPRDHEVQGELKEPLRVGKGLGSFGGTDC